MPGNGIPNRLGMLHCSQADTCMGESGLLPVHTFCTAPGFGDGSSLHPDRLRCVHSMNARLPAMRKATICCFCVQRSISPCKTDRGRCSPSPLASAKAGRQCGVCPYPITMDITAERRDVNTPCPRTDISILLQCGLFLLHITAEDAVDLRTLFPVKRIVRLDQPAVVNLDGL